MKIAVSAETTVDLTKDLLKEFDIHTVPFTVLLGDAARLDGDVDCEEIIDYVAKTGILPKTSAVNQFQFEEHFAKLLETYEGVIHFSLSSEMSSAFANAVAASKKFGGRVRVLDSRSLSTGIALLAIYASKLAAEGESLGAVAEKCAKRIPYVQAGFVLERLDYLYKGGRCSSLAYFGANLLKLRPQILVIDGKMGAAKKDCGKIESAVRSYCADTLERFDNPDLEVGFLTYTTATEGMLEEARKALKARGFKNIYETRAGGTITSHCGEHCLGILYINDGGKLS